MIRPLLALHESDFYSMAIRIISKSNQAFGAFNNGQIIENKPIGFPQDGGFIRPYSNLFYWAKATAVIDSTIALHPHQGFEIMSFVLRGNIRHFDTVMDGWKELNEGDVQIIRAGNGISHAEHMTKDSVMFQIWFDPSLSKTLNQEASYDDYKASSFNIRIEDGLKILDYVSHDAPIHMDTPSVTISRWTLDEIDKSMELDEKFIYSFYVLNGNVSLNNQSAEEDDFIIIEDEKKLELKGSGELFLIRSLKELDYPTYHEIVQSRMYQ